MRLFRSFIQTSIGIVPYDSIPTLIKDPDYDVFYKDGQLEVEFHPERRIRRTWFNSLSEKMKSNLGRMSGFGECLRCGNTWNWKRGHTIPYSKSRGMFPLCEERYNECSPEERYHFCLVLWERWGKPEDIDWKMLRKNIGFNLIHSLSRKVRTC